MRARASSKQAPGLWAKLQRDPTGSVLRWHSLVAHSVEVGAVLATLLNQPTIAARLAGLAGRTLDPTAVDRLCALAILHDLGKANRGFQARHDPLAPFVGHIDPVAWLFHGEDAADLFERLSATVGLDAIATWLPAGTQGLVEAVFAHHGAPWDRLAPNSRRLWCAQPGEDPIGTLASLAQAMRLHCPAAFEPGPALPSAPAFAHAFAGLLMLADWLASDTGFFPMLDGAALTPAEARARAAQAVATVGLDTVRAGPLPFAAAFGHPPRGLQALCPEPTARCVVLEAETGSGKTEAALWRYRSLSEQGAVDGLYFALPTRVAATAMFARIRAFRDAVFGPTGPAVVLAVPGQAAVDEAEGHPLPSFGFEWTDHAEGDARRRRWAAEHPKRFLAAPIAVGTIDQALLGAIRVRHSQMRGAALLRHLLVVDEVHASDPYMSVLLSALLRNHLGAGGHALLLSATLGAAARAKYLGTPCTTPEAAEATPYPALSWAEADQERRLTPAPRAAAAKTVTVEPWPAMDQPDVVATRALQAAASGAKVLVIRNTVRAAIATLQAMERIDPAHPSLFRVRDASTLHHGRFARMDRRALDHAVEATLGRASPASGRVVVGTQTLEVSLDLDADLLVTDLCPADVLLQRIGRLHRHARARTPGFEAPRAVVLVPDARDLVRFATRNATHPGGRHGLGSVYEDLGTIEATWQLIEANPAWTIPDHNRHLVERSTHPAHLARIEAELARTPAWQDHLLRREGSGLAQLQNAQSACLDWSTPFEDLIIPEGERIATRLGAQDRLIDLPDPARSPFGYTVRGLRVPHAMAEAAPPDSEPDDVTTDGDTVRFRLGATRFTYGRFGLQVAEG